MSVSSEEVMLLLSESTFASKTQREQETELLFEAFRVSHLCVVNEAVLGLYARGRTTGLVIDMGASVTQIVPIEEGYILPHAIAKMDIGGRQLTQYLSRMLQDLPGPSRRLLGTPLIEDMKKQLCYVALDFEKEMESFASSPATRSYVLPDGGMLEMGPEMARCPEALFQPSLLGSAEKGLPGRTQEVIELCGEEMKKDLYGNVAISGGSCLFRGLSERVLKELSQVAGPEVKVKVLNDTLRELLVWVGGSIYGSIPHCFGPSKWTTREDYQEYGPTVIHWKCIY